ncbi:hypothetical protein [Metamycoplasma hyosynoviae]|uniref:Uncharacterized protein n=1 Tax=Metamycoplasma hyosynoviae TaxID=29559 RepID=A0A4R7TYS7_9BACT|nr:hypothetical protein [Metamycoplasma hyosynoviae]MDD1359550.1 hypothetical protein [Metamycoplasma hyosynoviae]MDD1372106.1 hypothetical protein [Metamycoplasma hyosynoviae]TDU98082.1 hypothetical protein JN03_0091 [Metamycoplasma hyosynoviae]
MLPIQPIYYKSENQINETESFEKFKEKIDALKAKFDKKINQLFDATTLTKEKEIRIQTASIGSTSANVNDFVTEEEWKSIDHNIYKYITTFYNFHSVVRSTLTKIKEFLQTIDPLLEFGDNLSNVLSEMNPTGIPLFDTTVLVGKTVGAVLAALRVDNKKFEYSKEFILDILEKIIKAKNTKNIEILKSTLWEAKRILDEQTLSFSILLTLPIARRKVNICLNEVINIYRLAFNRYEEYLRNNVWGGGCY